MKVMRVVFLNLITWSCLLFIAILAQFCGAILASNIMAVILVVWLIGIAVYARRNCRCPKCGAFLPGNSLIHDSFCPKCGTEIKLRR